MPTKVTTFKQKVNDNSLRIITKNDIIEDVKNNQKLLKEQRDKKDKLTNKVKIPPFPIDAFPKPVQSVISEFQKAFQLPCEYFGLSILTVCAAAIGNSFCLQYKKGYSVPAIFYSAIVGNSSIGKTPALKLCLNPIFRLERKFKNEYKNDLAAYRLEVADLEEGQPIPIEPVQKEILINDATTEAINVVLSRNQKGILFFQDELVAWINSLNQYRRGSDTEFWLANWSNTTAKINRVSKPPLFIEKPAISVLGGIQPAVLESLGEGTKKENGFLYRILFAFPNEMKKPYESDYCVDSQTFEFYWNLINDLNALALTYNQVEESSDELELSPIPLTLNSKARELFKKFTRENTDLINEATNDSEKSLHGKLENYCLRFSLVLEILQNVSHKKEVNEFTEISEKSMKGSLKLIKYFRATGLKVLHKIEGVNPLENYTKIQQDVYEKLSSTFSTQDRVKIAEKCGMSARSFKRFLQQKLLFEKVSRGVYDKSL